MLFVIMTGCDIARFRNEEQIRGEITPVVSLLSLIHPLPIEMDEIMFDTAAHCVSECVLIVYVFV